jgi:hypothetical protein
MAGWNALFEQARPAFSQQRTCEPARTLGLSALGLPNKNSFAAPASYATKPLLIENHLQSAVLYASG